MCHSENFRGFEVFHEYFWKIEPLVSVDMKSFKYSSVVMNTGKS